MNAMPSKVPSKVVDQSSAEPVSAQNAPLLKSGPGSGSSQNEPAQKKEPQYDRNAVFASVSDTLAQLPQQGFSRTFERVLKTVRAEIEAHPIEAATEAWAAGSVLSSMTSQEFKESASEGLRRLFNVQVQLADQVRSGSKNPKSAIEVDYDELG